MKRCFASVGEGDSREVFTFDVDNDGPGEHARGKLSNFQPQEFSDRRGLYGEAYVAYVAFRRRLEIEVAKAEGKVDQAGYPSSSVHVDRMEDLLK